MADQGRSSRAAVEQVRDAADRPVSYEVLQDLLRAERRSNKLMPLSPRFWPQVRAFLQAVTDAFRLEQARDPFGRQVMRLTDEAKNARHAAEAVWALRERKLAMLALAAKDRRAPDGTTPEEGALYSTLLAALDDGRGKVFAGLGPPNDTKASAGLQLPLEPVDAAEPAPPTTPPRPSEPALAGIDASTPPVPSGSPASSAPLAASLPPGSSLPPASPLPPASSLPPRPPTAPVPSTDAPSRPPAPISSTPAPGPAPPEGAGSRRGSDAGLAPPAPPQTTGSPAPATTTVRPDTHASGPEMVTIRALGDIPPFVGPDMQTYLLREGDIATVPPSIANLLVRRAKAAIVDA